MEYFSTKIKFNYLFTLINAQRMAKINRYLFLAFLMGNISLPVNDIIHLRTFHLVSIRFWDTNLNEYNWFNSGNETEIKDNQLLCFQNYGKRIFIVWILRSAFKTWNWFIECRFCDYKECLWTTCCTFVFM